MIFKTMRRKDLHKALEGQENILTPAVSAHEKYFHNLSCSECGGDVMPTVNPRKLFTEGGLLPNFIAKCKVCGFEFSPYTGIVVSLPKD